MTVHCGSSAHHNAPSGKDRTRNIVDASVTFPGFVTISIRIRGSLDRRLRGHRRASGMATLRT